MTTLTNSFNGGSNGTNVTTGNSGGASGNAFDALNLGTGATATYDNTHVAVGSLACKLVNTSSSTFDQVAWTTSMGAQTQVWYRVYYYFTSAPPNEPLLQFKSGATTEFTMQVTASQLRALDSAVNNAFTFTATVPTNQWFRVEGFVIASATVGQMEMKLFSNASSTTPTETHTSTATFNTGASINQFFFGHNQLETIWMDELGLSNTGYLGPAVATTSGNIPALIP